MKFQWLWKILLGHRSEVISRKVMSSNPEVNGHFFEIYFQFFESVFKISVNENLLLSRILMRENLFLFISIFLYSNFFIFFIFWMNANAHTPLVNIRRRRGAGRSSKAKSPMNLQDSDETLACFLAMRLEGRQWDAAPKRDGAQIFYHTLPLLTCVFLPPPTLQQPALVVLQRAAYGYSMYTYLLRHYARLKFVCPSARSKWGVIEFDGFGITGEGILIELGVDVEEWEEIHTFHEYSAPRATRIAGWDFLLDGFSHPPPSLQLPFFEVSHRKKLTIGRLVRVYVKWRQYVVRQRPGVRIFMSFSTYEGCGWHGSSDGQIGFAWIRSC